MEERDKKFNPMGGLRKTLPDVRDFRLGNIVKLPKLEDLPKTFILETLEIKHQGNTDYCTAYASCLASELQENILLEPSWSFAASKFITQDKDEWGQGIREALKAHIDLGAIEQKDSPFNTENKDDQFLRDFNNWPNELRNNGYKNRKKSYFKIEGQYDHFDDLRASIWLYKTPIIMGLIWGWPLEQVYLEEPQESGFGHAISAIGFADVEKDGKVEPYLIIQNSYGKNAGENGKHYLSRRVVNDAVEKYMAFMFIDIPKEEAKFLNEHKLSTKWRFLNKLSSVLKSYFSFFLTN